MSQMDGANDEAAERKRSTTAAASNCTATADGGGRRTESRAAKQAVVLIHGMGEQRPMDTIKSFVRTVWELDDSVWADRLPNPAKVWSKPDDRTGSLELRRITTRESRPGGSFPSGVRTDFYELYWADLSAGSTWDQFIGWFRFLLLRPPNRIPREVLAVWALLVVASVAVALLGSLGLVPDAVWKNQAPAWLDQKAVIAIFAAGGAALHCAATRSFGRVARYTRAEPDNIAARAAIRKRGLDLLRALHGDRTYARVVLVGHSLGAILAHDLLSYFWAERLQARTFEQGSAAFAALKDIEETARALELEPTDDRRVAFVAAQAALRRSVAAKAYDPKRPDDAWLISDLVTLGSPLAHAEFLLAKSMEDLHERQSGRELPVCPPFRETLDPHVLAAAEEMRCLPIAVPPEATRLMVFPDAAGQGRWILHHAACFAMVRWTNLYDRPRFVALGDLIGGPAAPQFGPGIVDLDLSLIDRPSWRFTHTRYWASDQPSARQEALRAAVNLLDT